MEVLLTEDVVGLGDIGTQVKVKPGYARNFLIPRGKAIEVQSTSAPMLRHRLRQIESKKQALKVEAEKRAAALRDLAVTIPIRVGSSGKVFGSITSKDIANKLTELDFEIDRRRVLLSESIKKVGIHFVPVKVHAEVEATVKVEVVAMDASAEEEAQEVEEAIEALESNDASSDE